MILDYQNAKDGCALSLRDADEIERRSKETGIKLIETEEQMALLKSEILQLQNVKKEQEGLLDDIKKVCSLILKLFLLHITPYKRSIFPSKMGLLLGM